MSVAVGSSSAGSRGGDSDSDSDGDSGACHTYSVSIVNQGVVRGNGWACKALWIVL